MHAHEPSHHHAPDTDWAAVAADIALEGEVLMPYWTETASWVAGICRREGLEVRRIVDVGCGPGVGTCVLAQQFEPAVVLAVDASNEMLDRTRARAEALGLSGRVETQRVELPAGLDRLGGANLIWVAMVLHHISDQVATLRELRSLLEPGGVLAVTEFGDPPNILPADVDVDRPGLRARLGDVNLTGLASPVDFPTIIEEAGFEHVAERWVRVHLDPPLPGEARRVALRYLQRMRQLAGERLDENDHATLDVLMDEDAPLGIMRRGDACLHVSRQIYVARVGK